MATMGIKELRDTLTQVLRRVEAGERVEVTRDGEPVALIVPHVADPLERLIAEGRARPALHSFRPPPRMLTPRPGAPSTTEIIAADRDDR